MKTIPVLIVGAGPVGLSLALALARQQIPSVLIEKQPGPSQHPRARGVSMRTMELFKLWGNIDELLQYEFPKEAIRFIWSESLQGNEITRIEIKGKEYTHGPITASFVTQDCVESYLRQTLKKHDTVEIHFSRELLAFEESDHGVTVRIRNRQNDQEEIIQAQYLIAADGAHSRIRKQSGIEMTGPDDLGRFCSVYCEFDVSQWTQHRPSIAYFFTNPALANRPLFTAYGKNRWIVGMRFNPDQTKEDFTDEYCCEEIRRVTRQADLPIHIINKKFWTMAAQIAQEYRRGRVLLVGDAAHRLPPTGGLGMNTGVQDAHNLAWKLAFVLRYGIPDTLLNTYYEERAPVAKRNIEWSANNAKRFVDIAAAIRSGDMDTLTLKLHDQQKNLNYEGLDLGFIYHSSAVLSENDETISIAPTHYQPTTLPGSRAPFVKLLKHGEMISTLELFEKTFVLLVGKEGQAWQTAGNKLSHTLPFPISIYRVASDGDLIDTENTWLQVYQLSPTGAVLVRPDGHVAWRSHSMVDHPESTLQHCFENLNLIGLKQ